MSSSSTSLSGILDVSSLPVYWYRRVSRAIRRLHPSLREAEGHMFGPQPGISQSHGLLQLFE
jgi:hypothetical protein